MNQQLITFFIGAITGLLSGIQGMARSYLNFKIHKKYTFLSLSIVTFLISVYYLKRVILYKDVV